MTQQEFESYLTLMSRLLKLSDKQREAIAGELDDHLQQRLQDLQSQGVPQQEAVRLALEEFGDAAALARDFQEVSRNRKKRWIMRMTVGSLSAALAGLLIVSLYWPAGNGPGTPQQVVAQEETEVAAEQNTVEEESKKPSIPVNLNRRIVEALKTTSEITVDSEPLADIIQTLGELHDMNTYIDERALVDGEVSVSEITMDISGVPLEAILDLMLSQHDLTYTIRSGILIVTTMEKAEENPVVRVYNVHSLLAARGRQKKLEHLIEVVRSAASNMHPLRAALTQNHFATEVFQDNNVRSAFNTIVNSLENLKQQFQDYSSQQLPSYAARTQSLVDLITSTVDSPSWQENGGSQGFTLVPFKGSLIVTTTVQTHLKVEKLLQDLEMVAEQNEDAPFLPHKISDDKNRSRGGEVDNIFSSR